MRAQQRSGYRGGSVSQGLELSLTDEYSATYNTEMTTIATTNGISNHFGTCNGSCTGVDNNHTDTTISNHEATNTIFITGTNLECTGSKIKDTTETHNVISADAECSSLVDEEGSLATESRYRDQVVSAPGNRTRIVSNGSTRPVCEPNGNSQDHNLVCYFTETF